MGTMISRGGWPRSSALLLLSLVICLFTACNSTASTTPIACPVVSECGGPPIDQGPLHHGGTITVTINQAPDSANILSRLTHPSPANSALDDALWGMCIIQLPDLRLGLNGWRPDQCSEVPSLANGDESRDGLTTKLKVDPNSQWSDGQSLTAADFAFYYAMATDPHIGGDPAPFDHVAQIQILDPQTLLIHWKTPNVAYLSDISCWPPEPLHAINTGAYAGVYAPQTGAYDSAKAQRFFADLALVNALPSNGPYHLASSLSGSTITLKPNLNYHSNFFHKPVLDALKFTVIPNVPSAVEAFKAAQVDMVDGLTYAQSLLPGIPQNEIFRSPSTTLDVLAFNERAQAPHAVNSGGTSIFAGTQGQQVRQAFAKAIDRCALASALVPVNSCQQQDIFTDELTIPELRDSSQDVKIGTPDAAAAAQLLDQAGYHIGPGGLRMYAGGETPIQLVLRVSDQPAAPSRMQMVQALAQQLQHALSIIVNVQVGCVTDCGGARLQPNQYDLLLFAADVGTDSSHAAQLLQSQPLTCAAQCQPTSGEPLRNFAGVSDPQIDADIQQGQRDPDPIIQNQKYQALYTYAAGRYDYLPLYILPNVELVKARVKGFQLNQFNPVLDDSLWNVGGWWVSA